MDSSHSRFWLLLQKKKKKGQVCSTLSLTEAFPLEILNEGKTVGFAHFGSQNWSAWVKEL